MSKEESTPYSFQGDNAKLVDSIKSLLALDSKGALVPHGVCGLARQLLESSVERLAIEAQPAAWQIRSQTNRIGSVWTAWRECSDMERAMHSHEVGKFNRFGIMREIRPLFARSDAGEAERLNTVIEQQKSLIASLRAELRDSYSIDAAVQEEHLDIEAAAKKLAACMDYPWEHMPEQGRASMREHATAVIGAALPASAEPTTIAYRLLAAGDTIAATDENLGDDAATWSPVGPGIFNGMKYISGAMLPVRRAITIDEPTTKEIAQ